MAPLTMLAIFTLTLAAIEVDADRRAAVNDYVVVYARILGCADFPGIIGVPQVSPGGTIELPQLPPFDVLNRTAAEIEVQVGREVAKVRPYHDVPRSLQIEVIGPNELPLVSELYLASLRYLAEDRCTQPSEIPRWVHPEQRNRALEVLDWRRTAAR